MSKCKALYMKKTGDIRCGQRDIPWVSDGDYLDEIELHYKREMGECQACPSLLLALSMKVNYETKTTI